MQELWGFVVDNRETLTWIGGGIAAFAGGVWAVFKHFFPSETKRPATTVNMSGTGIVSGRDTLIDAPVQIGLDEKKTRRAIEQAIKPLSDKFEQIIANISREKGVPAPPLRTLLRQQVAAGFPEQNLPGLLGLLGKQADELGKVREGLALIKQTSSPLVPFADQARASIDRGDLVSAESYIARGVGTYVPFNDPPRPRIEIRPFTNSTTFRRPPIGPTHAAKPPTPEQVEAALLRSWEVMKAYQTK
jgi:hypothetical protein